MPSSGGGGFLGALGNAAGGALGGGLVGGAITGLEHLFGLGGAPREDPVTQQARQLQLAAQQRQMQFANSVPGSDPSELASLSQERGALGAAQRQQQQSIFGAYNPAMGNNGLGDLLKNLTNSQIGQSMSLQESHLMNALSARRQALTEAANSGGRVQGPQYQPQSDLPQLLGQVAQSISYQMGKNKGGGAGTGQGSGVAGDVPVGNTSYTGAPMAGPPQPNAIPWAGIFNGGAGASPTSTDYTLLGNGGSLAGAFPPATPGAGGAASPDTAPGIPQPLNSHGGGSNLNGVNALNNQWRQSTGFPAPWAGGMATPSWLKF